MLRYQVVNLRHLKLSYKKGTPSLECLTMLQGHHQDIAGMQTSLHASRSIQ